MKNRKNNKGFSLVELIVVVAIMAVLVGVLAPAYLKYVENSRISKDESAAEEVRHAVEIAIADESVYDTLADNDTVVIPVGGGTLTTTSSSTTLLPAVTAVTGTSVDFSSKEYADNKYTVTIDLDTLTVTGAFGS